ncbi:hypothetical protein ACWIG4_18335 [Streptomyces sp. NPDC002248]
MPNTLPCPGSLTPRQVRGTACVWCGTPLDPGRDDVDLGARRDHALGITWFPRACTNCHRTKESQ